MDLNISNVVLVFMWRGRLFHKEGAATEKALSPFVLRFAEGVRSGFCMADRSLGQGDTQ